MVISKLLTCPCVVAQDGCDFPVPVQREPLDQQESVDGVTQVIGRVCQSLFAVLVVVFSESAKHSTKNITIYMKEINSICSW